MKNSSTVAIEGYRDFQTEPTHDWFGSGRSNQPLLCLELKRAKSSWNRELARTPKGFQPVFRKIPRSRIALETYSQPAQGTRENLRDSRKDHRSLTVGA